MLHTKYHGNQPAGSGEVDFKRVLTIYGHGSHLGQVTSIMSLDFYFLVPESFHKKMVQIGKVVSEKIRFEFLYVHNLGQRSRYDLTFNTHIPSYIQLDDCSYQLSGHWLQ